MFPEIYLKNFRGFSELHLEGLKRVNLIVGKNNAGKTSLLEGIQLLAMPEKIDDLSTLLRPPIGKDGSVFFRWLIRDGDKSYTSYLQCGTRQVYLVDYRKGSREPHSLKMSWHHEPYRLYASKYGKPVDCRVVSVQPKAADELVNLFAAAIRKRNGEEQMDSLFNKLDNRIRKVRIIPSADVFQVMFDVGLSEMVPLSQLGQGVQRLLTIFSELIAGESQICIIDEIENGIHHSMLEQVWQGIAAAAETLNVQVFATTHSHECIESAHAAFSKREPYDLSVIQLFRVEGEVQGKVLDQKHIEAAMSGEIDLR